MNQTKNGFRQSLRANQMRSQPAGQPHKLGVMQPKTTQAAQGKKPSVTPPVYRPQSPPSAAQPKIANGAVNRKPPVAPAVYRPQSPPCIAQAKMPPRAVAQLSGSAARPGMNNSTGRAGAAKPTTMPATSCVQMEKKSKQVRRTEKWNKKRNNVFVQQHGEFVGPSTVVSIAANGGKRYQANSGAHGPGTLTGATYLATAPSKPWDGKTSVTGFAFINCAEAQVWALIKANGEDPKNFILTSYQTKKNKMKEVPPCANCKQWVGDAFKSVSKIDATY